MLPGTENALLKSIGDLNIEISRMRDIIKAQLEKSSANIRYSSDVNPFRQHRFTVYLDRNNPTTGKPEGVKGNPFKLGFPITSLRFVSASSNGASIKVSVGNDVDQQIDNYTTMQVNDVINFDKEVDQVCITWDDQPGVSAVIVAYVDIRFESGTQVSTISGGVNISSGTAWSSETPVALSGTAVQIAATDSTRKQLIIGNPRTSGVDVWLGGSSAVDTESGATPGVLLEPGDYFYYDGQGPVFGITAGGAVSVTVQELS